MTLIIMINWKKNIHLLLKTFYKLHL